MQIEFDIAKNAANIAKHGTDLGNAVAFDFETALTWTDVRADYGETRTPARHGLHPSRRRHPDHQSRKANKQEIKRYVRQA